MVNHSLLLLLLLLRHHPLLHILPHCCYCCHCCCDSSLCHYRLHHQCIIHMCVSEVRLSEVRRCCWCVQICKQTYCNTIVGDGINESVCVGRFSICVRESRCSERTSEKEQWRVRCSALWYTLSSRRSYIYNTAIRIETNVLVLVFFQSRLQIIKLKNSCYILVHISLVLFGRAAAAAAPAIIYTAVLYAYRSCTTSLQLVRLLPLLLPSQYITMQLLHFFLSVSLFLHY